MTGGIGDGGEDPRTTDDHLRRVVTPWGNVTLVGVVHDHPASVHRAATVVEELDPAVLALELPPLALPLFEQYALDNRVPPVFGGEMSAAIQAAATAHVVGIDGPTRGFLLELARTLYRERASLATVRKVAAGLRSVGRETLACRAASVVAGLTGVRLAVDSPVEHEVSRSADPERQAEDERVQIRRARAVMNAFEPSRATYVRDAARERHMARRLERLCLWGDVVAVVGHGHLDRLTDRLTGTEAT